MSRRHGKILIKIEDRKMTLSTIDQKILELLQTDFPITGKPYIEIGKRLGISEDDVIARIGEQKTTGLVRQIGPVVDAASLGYKTTLVAMNVPEAELDKASDLINEHPGISHAYKRAHHFNFWYTLALPGSVDADAEIQKIADRVNSKEAFSLPALKIFKLRAYFAMTHNDQPVFDSSNNGSAVSDQVDLSGADRAVINALQQELPLISEPFAGLAADANMNEDEFLTVARSLLARGVFRRYGAAVNHHKAGFAANAMTCWIAPPEKVEEAGAKLASLRAVSHCYERRTNPAWDYNIFAMIHAHTKDECQQIVDNMCKEIGLDDYLMLFSTQEYKKIRTKYLV
jgi:DNA-binding Lrp family transcriptional regulator